MRGAKIRRIVPIVLLLIAAAVAVVYLYSVSGKENGALQVSGTIEAQQVDVGPEIAGRVAQVLVQEGDSVEQGQALLVMDDILLQGNRESSLAALESARASAETASAAVHTASIQLEIARLAARPQERAVRQGAWGQGIPNSDALPAWYLDLDEQFQAAEEELQAAQEGLQTARDALEVLLSEEQRQELQSAEEKLAQAQLAYALAEEVLQRARLADESKDLISAAEDEFDSAKDALDTARTDYDDLLDGFGDVDILDARAALAVAQSHLDLAQERVDSLQVGERSLQVQLAEATYVQAQLAAAQAQAMVAQIQTQIASLDLQLEKLTVRAPLSGTIITRDVEPGAVLQAGASALSIGRLDDLRITVYIAEDRYGQLRLGMGAIVSVDSFPGETFNGVVVHIADRAEFTPRNVQTEEGRRIMVFAVEVSVSDMQGRLKPGMPADVVFELP
jgi:HlyD family secretion protein